MLMSRIVPTVLFASLVIDGYDAASYHSSGNNGYWNGSRRKCKKCPYGYKSDVEGNPICTACRDPCSSVKCLGGICVVRKSKTCRRSECPPIATCKDVKRNENADQHFLNSAVSQTWVGDSQLRAMCREPPDPMNAPCFVRQARWFYDSQSGHCRQFQGCIGLGNNFVSKSLCAVFCASNTANDDKIQSTSDHGEWGTFVQADAPKMSKYTSSLELSKPTKKISVCVDSLPVDAKKCKRKRRRWYYDANSRRCIRFKGCETPGNNFSRKYLCKNQCIPKFNGGYRFLKHFQVK